MRSACAYLTSKFSEKIDAVEYLVTGKNHKEPDLDTDIQKFHKYAKTINDLDSIPEKTRKPIIAMISQLSEELNN